MRPVAVGMVRSVEEPKQAGDRVRILVIDDYLNVEMALRGILDGHTVTGVRDPRALPRMLAKRADAYVTRAVVEAIGRGEPSPSPDAAPFRKAATMRPPLLDQLVHNRTELGIWQELARFDKRLQIANAAHVHPRTLDAFTAAKGAAIDALTAWFPRPLRGAEPAREAPGEAGPAAAHGANLIRV